MSVDQKSQQGLINRWTDGSQRLEQQIAAIAADLVVLGEETFRQGLVEQREWSEQRLRWAEEASRAERKRLEEARLANLKESGVLLHRAGEIRALVDHVEAAIADGSVAVTGEQLARWRSWALGEADRIDPVLSGQVLSHLVVPKLDNQERD